MEEVSNTGWNGHKWRDANPRRLQVGAGTPVLHQHCVQCGRDFLMDLTSRRSRAVSISAVSFHQLDDAVTERWLRESCPGTHLLGDEEDRKSKIAELLVFDEPLVRSNEPLVRSKQKHR
jgi:hypothetical protein